MGVEGKDKAKVLEAGAAALSGQLGRTVAKLRKSSGLSLADLSAQSGVAKSIISQIERNETNPTLTTIWRFAHALDVSIGSILHGAEEGPFVERVSRGETPILVSDDGLCRLAVIGWPKTVDGLQWYDFQAEPGGVSARSRTRAARSSACQCSKASSRSRSAKCSRSREPARRCAIAATARTQFETAARRRRRRRWCASSKPRRWIDGAANDECESANADLPRFRPRFGRLFPPRDRAAARRLTAPQPCRRNWRRAAFGGLATRRAKRSESRRPRFVPGLFALSTGLSRFRSAADPAPRRGVHHRPRPAADSTRNFRKMRIRVARRRFVPVLFSLSLAAAPYGNCRAAANLRLICGERGRPRLDSAAGGG